jgi:hypothetical protein
MDWRAKRSRPTASPTSAAAAAARRSVRLRPAEYSANPRSPSICSTAARPVRREGGDSPGDRRDARRDRLSDRPLTDIAEEHRGPPRRGRAGAGDRPGPRPAGSRRAQPRRMPRAAGQGGRPLRPGDGAADRQSRPAREGPHGDLKRICGVDDEDLADMVRELRAYDPKPGCRFAGQGAAEASRPTCSSARPRRLAVELNQATLPRLLVNRRYYQELKSGPQDKASKAWLSECLPAPTGWSRRSTSARGRSSRS